MASSSSSSSCSSTSRPEDRVGQLLAHRLKLTSVLGVGAYGVVYNAIDIMSYTPYAVKALPAAGLDQRQRRFQQREISLHYKASRHDNIVSLVEILEAPDCTYVVMEYCPEGDLFANITERRRYVGNDYMAKRVFLQLISAVEHCHALGIYHRDLKPENVLVCDRGLQVKLADFGLATTERFTSDFGCGSTFYMSPECQQTSPRNANSYDSVANDVWSLGVILVNLTCGRNPWKRAHFTDSTFRAFCEKPGFLRTILPLSGELESILRLVFELNPKKRISLGEFKRRIQHCPRFTTGPTMMDIPQTPSSELSEDEFVPQIPVHTPQKINFNQQLLTPPQTPPAEAPLHPIFFAPQQVQQQQQQQQVPQEEEYVSVDYPETVASSPVIVSASPDFLSAPPRSQQQTWQFPNPTSWAAPIGERFRNASLWRGGHFVMGPGIKAC